MIDGIAAKVDQINAAIDAAVAPQAVAMHEFRVTIASTGRPVVVVLPTDATDGEIAEVAGWLLTSVLGAFRAERERGPAARLFVPGR